MQINAVKNKSVSMKRDRVKDPLTYFLGGPKNAGSEQLPIFKNDLTQRFKLGRSG